MRDSSEEGECINSVRVSSYVQHKVGLVNGIKPFGPIQFDYMFNGHLHCVCWYDRHNTDRDSGLIQVSTILSTSILVIFLVHLSMLLMKRI